MEKGGNKGAQSKGKPNNSKGKGGTADVGGRTAKGEGKKGSTSKNGTPTLASDELPKELEAISRELVQFLRHKGLQDMRPDGFAPLNAVVAALRTQPTRDQVEAVVLLSKKEGVARFELHEEDGEKWVRAKGKVSLFGSGRPQQQQQAAAAATATADMAYAGRSTHQQSLQQLQGHPTSSLPEAEDSGRALHDFDGSSYGSEYLSLSKDEDLIWCRDFAVDAGWAFGKTMRSTGWFPANLWAPAQQSRMPKQMSGSPGQAMPQSVHEMAAELSRAHAQIRQLQAELARERERSAQMKQALEAAEARASASRMPQQTTADVSTSAFHDHQRTTADGGVSHFPTLEESATAPPKKSNNGHTTDKQKLVRYLSDTFPGIENHGVQYHVTDRKVDVQGRTLWCASVEVKELKDSFKGEYCPSQKDAEQSAAFHALLQLGGPAVSA